MVKQDMDKLSAMLDESEDLRRTVRSPAFSVEDQARAMEAILSRVGASAITMNFIRLVSRNRRLFAVQDMIKIFNVLEASARGEVQADVMSATPLTDAQIASLKQTLKASIGKDVNLVSKIDPSLLGGLIVKIGSRMIDTSLRTKLSTLKMRMKEVG